MVPLIPTPWVLLLVSCGSFFAGRWSCAAARKEMLIDVAPEVLPLLYDPPRGHGAVEVPSVKRDARGAVHNLQIGSFRFNVLESACDTPLAAFSAGGTHTLAALLLRSRLRCADRHERHCSHVVEEVHDRDLLAGLGAKPASQLPNGLPCFPFLRFSFWRGEAC